MRVSWRWARRSGLLLLLLQWLHARLELLLVLMMYGGRSQLRQHEVRSRRRSTAQRQLLKLQRPQRSSFAAGAARATRSSRRCGLTPVNRVYNKYYMSSYKMPIV